jgi:hypothetical protein
MVVQYRKTGRKAPKERGSRRLDRWVEEGIFPPRCGERRKFLIFRHVTAAYRCMLCCLVDIVSTGVTTNTSSLFRVTHKPYMADRWLTAI